MRVTIGGKTVVVTPDPSVDALRAGSQHYWFGGRYPSRHDSMRLSETQEKKVSPSPDVHMIAGCCWVRREVQRR